MLSRNTMSLGKFSKQLETKASSPRSCLVRKTKEKMEGQKYIAADVYHHHLLAFT